MLLNLKFNCLYIILGTIRRILEYHESKGDCYLETVVLAVESCDAGIYEVLLPLYFPRSIKEEEAAVLQLPTGKNYGLFGEPVFPDRQIRIIDNPHHHINGEYLCYYFCFINISKVVSCRMNDITLF